MLGFERYLRVRLRRLDLMLAFVVLNKRALKLLVVGAVEHRAQCGHAQREQQYARGHANETRRQAEHLTHLPKEYRPHHGPSRRLLP